MQEYLENVLARLVGVTIALGLVFLLVTYVPSRVRSRSAARRRAAAAALISRGTRDPDVLFFGITEAVCICFIAGMIIRQGAVLRRRLDAAARAER